MEEPLVGYDYLIQNAKVFDGSLKVQFQDIAIAAGRIVARGSNLDVDKASQVIDADGLLAMPGLFDIHTHYDLELEIDPRIPESVRHGTTSVVIANCSLGLAFGNQRVGSSDPIVDCYARVENLPKSVLKRCADKVTWNNPKEYLEHLNERPIGPNVIPMIPHSMLRIEVMGFEASINRDPTKSELDTMYKLLDDSLKFGYAGFSTDALPFHYLSNQPNCHKTIPTQFAKYKEIKILTNSVRENGAIWQATPPKDSVLGIIKTFMLTSGRFFSKPLKTTVVAVLDVTNNFRLLRLSILLSKILNSKLLNGDFHMQALSSPFKIWSDGPITPLAEEIPELRLLNEFDLEDKKGRLKLLDDPEYISRFKKMWLKGKSGFNIARLKRKLNLEDYAFNRSMDDMFIDRCPFKSWEGHSFTHIFERLMSFHEASNETNSVEQEFFAESFNEVKDEADFVLQMLRVFDLELGWSTVTANRNAKTTRKTLMNPLFIPGFNDSGAHLTNMAFYDGNLVALQTAMQSGDKDLAYMVRRLTKDAADLFGVSGGSIEVGEQADLILINPEKLHKYDSQANIQRVYRKEFDSEQLVNRSNGVVPMVMINGEVVWQNEQYSNSLGKRKIGNLKLTV